MKVSDLLVKVLCDFEIVYLGEWTSYNTNNWLEADDKYGDKKVSYIHMGNKKITIGVEDE